MCEEKVPLFVSAVGIPPKQAIDKLKQNGILYANLIGSPKQVLPCIKSGADIIIATGGESGGHTGDISTMVLLP
jgi:NAD(P)H-dependent flavin oxidoreductase YrpB (nitropropane dioxygenase family)